MKQENKIPEEELLDDQENELVFIDEDPEEVRRKLKKSTRRFNEFQQFGLHALVFVLILYVLFAWIIGVTAPPNSDMYPRIDSTDLLVYYRLDKSPSAQDIIVFTKNNTRYVGRVIAKGGDTIDITDTGSVIVNDSTLVESNIFYETYPLTGYTQYPLTLAEDECFVLMDQRRGTEDSRYFGAVKYKEIDGTVITVFRRVNF